MIRAFTYGRYSSASQNPATLETQDEHNGRWCRQHKYKIVGKFEDAAKSGRRIAGRNGFREMLQRAKNGECDIIVCYMWSRFGRDLDESYDMYLQMKHAGVGVESSAGDNDTITRIMGMYVAELDNTVKAKAVRDSMARAAKQGRHLTRAPFGYLKNEDGKLILDPINAPTIQRIFNLYTKEGKGMHRIGNILNADDIKTPTGRQWSTNTVRSILRNPTYRGDTVWNMRETVSTPAGGNRQVLKPESDWITKEETHTPIIDRPQWHDAQALMEINARDNRQLAGYGTHLMTGTLVCACCGAYYQSKKYGKYGEIGGPRFTRFSCGSRLKNRELCANVVTVREDVINEWMKIEVLPATISKENMYEARRQAQEAHAARSRDGAVVALQKKRDALSRQISNLVTAIANGRAPESILEQIEQLETDRDAVNAELAELKQPDDAPIITREDIKQIVEGFNSVIQDPDVPDAIIKNYMRDAIENITINPDGRIVATSMLFGSKPKEYVLELERGVDYKPRGMEKLKGK